MRYYRPIPRTDPARPEGALTLAGGWCWFDTVEVLTRDAAPYLMPARDLPDDAMTRLTAPRAPVASLDMTAPQIMGILCCQGKFSNIAKSCACSRPYGSNR